MIASVPGSGKNQQVCRRPLFVSHRLVFRVETLESVLGSNPGSTTHFGGNYLNVLKPSFLRYKTDNNNICGRYSAGWSILSETVQC